ncbi:siroheme synthase, partial [Escherichia coli]|uniref:precorrin-2 dehydrogenase/sirohydrochlorin ferrochelatase family protein n=1 Tax=Escherichia coli TaxID=562 RepID=UPI000D449651
GGDIASRKIALLQRAGAEVKVVAQSLADELAAQLESGKIQWLDRHFTPTLLSDVFLVIAATDDAALNAAVFEAANQRHLLVNVVDDQPKCSFIFPSIIDRSPLVVAI